MNSRTPSTSLARPLDRPPRPRAARAALGLAAVLSLAAPVVARDIEVPRDFPTIKAAVAAALDGDAVLVDDGTYNEDNIIVDRKIRVLSKRPFGAVVYGSLVMHGSIFIVRAEAEIAGFVLRNGDNGITQRESPDVAWSGHDLIIQGMSEAAVFVNDKSDPIGLARLWNILADHCRVGVSTNDGRGVALSDSLVANCGSAFVGFDHRTFTVERTSVWNCPLTILEAADPPPGVQVPRGVKTVTLGPGVSIVAAPEWTPAGGGNDPLDRFLPRAWTRGDAATGRSALVRRAAALLSAGEAWLESPSPSNASGFLRSALETGLRLDLDEIVWQAEYARSRLAEREGRLADAAADLNRAVESFERIARSVRGPALQATFFQDKVRVFDALVDLLTRMDRSEPGRGHASRALEWEERSRAAAGLDAWDLAGAEPAGAVSPGVRRREAALREEMTRLQTRLLEAPPGDIEAGLLYERLDRVESEYQTLVASVRDAGPGEPASLRSPRFDEIRAALPDGTGLLEFALGDRRSIAFLLTPDDFAWAELPTSSVVLPMARDYLMFLTVRDEPRFSGARGGRRLFEMLLGPLAPRLRGLKRLLVVPDSGLFHLPFEALVLPAADGAPPRYLAEDLDVSYLISAADLVRSARRPPGLPPAKDVLAVGASDVARTITWPSFSRVRLDPLGRARDEVDAIVRLFEPGRADRLVGPDASEDRLRRLDLGSYRILHFACHGLVQDQLWWRSSLVLEPGSPDQDGLLTVVDLYGVRLRADLAVLSACRTAASRVDMANGPLGLARGFLAAGARAVVSSLWAVEDGSTAEMMKRFYAALRTGAPPAGALAAVKRGMLATRWSHPFHWAGFVLTGDGGPAAGGIRAPAEPGASGNRGRSPGPRRP